MKKRIPLLLSAVILLAASCVTMEGAGRVTLTGTGTVTAVPDRAGFALTFRETGMTSAEARDKVNSLVGRALSVLASAGVKSEDIRTTGISYYEKKRWDEGEEIFLGQEAVQTLNVSLDLVGEAENLNSLIDDLTGIDGIGMGGLSFTVSGTSPYYEEARRLAFEDARARAMHYAELSGRNLGKLLSLTEQGGYVPPAANRLMEKAVMESPGTQVQTGLNEITLTILVEFELE